MTARPCPTCGQPLPAEGRRLFAAYLEARAAKLERHGGKASARQLRIAAQDVLAGLHEGEER